MPDKRAAILARCSTEANVCDQVFALKQYAREKFIVDEDDIYGDNIGGSSSVEERIELKRLMQNIEERKKQYSIVLVQDTKRLGKYPEQVDAIMKWFSEKNIPLHFQQA